MEVRRIQLTGGSSYIITLPKEWIKKLNIKKNDPIGLHIQSNGTILITPKISREQKQRIKTIKVEKTVEPEFLFRELVGAYIAGYNSIEIKAKDRMPPSARTTVRKMIQIAIGQEVVEETTNSIVIKDLLNPAEMPFKKTIKRMHVIVKSMHEDIMQSLKDKDKTIAEDVVTRDNEVDRLHWLIARQYNIILRNVNFAEKMDTTTEYASTSHLISKIIERIADHVTRIAYNIIELNLEEIDKKIIEKMIKANKKSLDIFYESIGTFIIKDVSKANKNIKKVEELVEECNQISSSVLKQKGATAVSLGYIIESTRRIGEYSEDICENVINYYVQQEN
ncbi:MAG: phosphate uptake regulator PhoU [Candidatus Thermoplasmatota archaeon]